MKLLNWNLYEISSKESSLNGVMLRGRIRKLGIENGFNVLVENTEDIDSRVRFAVLNDEDAKAVNKYLISIVPDVCVQLKKRGVSNPVLSKEKVNLKDRYIL